MTDAERFKKALQFLSNADDKVRMLKEIIELFCLDIEATQRPWVGLTDEEITELRLKTLDAVATNHEVYRVIEAKLKEKNSG